MSPAIALYRREKKAALKRRKINPTQLDRINAKWKALPPSDRGEYPRLKRLNVNPRDLGYLAPKSWR